MSQSQLQEPVPKEDAASLVTPSVVKIIIPDTGPLITLAKADALDLLLTFDDQVDVSITDVVEFEATRYKAQFEDAQRIFDFVKAHVGRIQIVKTDFGKQFIANERTRKRYEQSQVVRDFYAAQGLPAPGRGVKNPGEVSIIAYVSELIGAPPGPPCLIIAEDDYFLRAKSGALPGNAHIVSTAAMLKALEKLNATLDADAIMEAVRNAGRTANGSSVDKPADMVEGGTDWASVVDQGKLSQAITTRKARAGR